MTLEDINNIDLVDFLKARKIYPQKISQHYNWYNSMLPGQPDHSLTFLIDRPKNRWQDFSSGASGGLTDWCQIMYGWSAEETLSWLSTVSPEDSQPILSAQSNIQILTTSPIQSQYLIQLLWENHIQLAVARKHSVEVHYSIQQKAYYAIGFPTPEGGYQLKNKTQIISSGPSSPTLIFNRSDHCCLFEQFWDLLTFLSITSLQEEAIDLVVLNDPEHLKQTLPKLQPYSRLHCFFTNSPHGDHLTYEIKQHYPQTTDHRPLYSHYKSLNPWVCNFGLQSSNPARNAYSPFSGLP